MLHDLHIQGFKKHNDLSIPLQPGLNYVVGPNYSGKSSILHSILFALGGVTAVPGGAEVAYSWSSKKTKVQLGWGNNSVVRTRTSGGTELLQGSQSVASGLTAVNKRLTKVFGMPAKDLMKIIYAEQGSTAALVSELGEGEVNRLIETLSGVQEVDMYIKAISSMRAEVKGGLASVTASAGEHSAAQLGILMATAVAELKIKALELAQEKKVGEKAEAELAALDQQYTTAVAAEATAERIATLTARVVELKEQKDSVPLEVEITEEQIDDAKTLAKSEEESSRDLREAFRQSTQHAADIASAEAEVSRYQAKCMSPEEMKKATDDAAKYKSMFTDAQDTYASLEKEETQVSTEISAKRSLLAEGACPTCHRPYEANEEDLEALEQEIPVLIGQYARLTETRQEAAATVKSLTSSLQAAKQLVSQDQSAQYSLAESVTRLDSLKKVSRETISEKDLQESIAKVEALKESLHNLITLRTAWVRSVDHHRRAAEIIETTESSLQGYREEMQGYGIYIASDEILALRQTAAKANRASFGIINGLSVGISKLEQQKKHYKKDLQVEMERARQEAELTNREAGLSRLRKFLMDNRARFLEGVWTKVLTYASQVMRVTTGGLLEELSRVEGAFRYREEGSDKFRPLAAASGSQKSIIGIGLKLALAKSLPCGVDFILLDEATSDMDAVHSAALMKYLAGCGLQIVSVTHNQEDLAVDANVVQLG